MKVATFFIAMVAMTGLLNGLPEKEDVIANASCPRCVEAREYNRTHPNPYFYYDDYVEAKKEGQIEEKSDASKPKMDIE